MAEDEKTNRIKEQFTRLLKEAENKDKTEQGDDFEIRIIKGQANNIDKAIEYLAKELPEDVKEKIIDQIKSKLGKAGDKFTSCTKYTEKHIGKDMALVFSLCPDEILLKLKECDTAEDLRASIFAIAMHAITVMIFEEKLGFPT